MAIAPFAAHPARNLFPNGCTTVTTNKQRAVSVRPGARLDADLLAQMYRRLSERTIELRYGAPRPRLPEEVIRAEMARMFDADPRLATTLIGTVGGFGSRSAVAVAELVQSAADRSSAEIALLVRDDFQREGLGRALAKMLYDIALLRGVRLLRAYLLAENVAIVRLLRGMGMRYSAETRRGETTILIPLDAE
jgi:GNAT superfamily N-acetyltransferase